MNMILWILQVLLAGLFLFAGGMKLVLPADALAGPVALPLTFIRFIGVCEVAGALGLVLPWLFRIRPVLTPLAGSGLAIIMVGATVITLIGGMGAGALVPAVTGVLAGVVAYHRFRGLRQNRTAGGPRNMATRIPQRVQG